MGVGVGRGDSFCFLGFSDLPAVILPVELTAGEEKKAARGLMLQHLPHYFLSHEASATSC